MMTQLADRPADTAATGHHCPICRHALETAEVCASCRRWLAKDLGEIAGLAGLLPLVTAPPSGSEAGLPIRISVVDLGLPARGGAGSVTIHDPYGDQGGQIPVAARLDSWVQDWITHRRRGEHAPAPSVPNLVGWLLARLDDACDTHPAVSEFAGEVRTIKSAINRVLSTEPLRAVEYEASCPRCESKTLTRGIGANWIECGGCGRLWDDEHYAHLVRDVIPAGRLLNTLEAAAYAGVKPARIRFLIHHGKLHRDIGPWGSHNLRPEHVRAALNLDDPMRTPMARQTTKPMTAAPDPTPPPARPARYIVLGTALTIRDWRVEHSIPSDRVIAACSPNRLRGLTGGPFIVVTLDSWPDVPAKYRSQLLADLLTVRATRTGTVTDYVAGADHD